MILYFIVLLFTLSLLNPNSIVEYFTHLFAPFHSACLNLTQLKDANQESLVQALVCGKNIDSIQLKNTLIQSGLIHVLVVSGSHLNTLNHFLNIIINWIFQLLIKLKINFLNSAIS